MRSEQVKAFVITAETGSFSSTGKKLALGRSTISAMISALEDNLGIALFFRSGNSLTITPAGKALLADAQRLVQAAEHMQQLAQQQIDGVESELRIARDDALPERFWHECMQALQQKFPRTSVAAYLVPCKEHQHFMQQHIVDIAFGVNAQAAAEHQLATIAQYIVVHPDHPLAQLGQVTEHDLQQHKQICLTYLHQQQLISEHRISQYFVGLTMFEVIRDAILQNDGWAILPSTLIQPEIRQRKLKVLTCDAITTTTYLQCLTHSKQQQVATWLQNKVREYSIN